MDHESRTYYDMLNTGIVNISKSDCENACNYLVNAVKQYKRTHAELFKTAEKSAARFEYGKGGETLHRGYYCPSPIIDIIAGGCNRGKILKRLTSNSTPSYKYGFNDENNIIFACNIIDKLNEVIINKNNLSIGIVFSENYGIHAVAECLYDKGNIIFYNYGVFNPFSNSIDEVKIEMYEYSNFGIDCVYFINFFYDRKNSIFKKEKFKFYHNENGFISKFDYYAFDDNSEIRKIETYDVKVERKI